MQSAVSSPLELAPWIERIEAKQKAIREDIAPNRIRLYMLASRLLSVPRRTVNFARGTRQQAVELQLPWLPVWSGLTAKPFHDPRDFPWTRVLEEGVADIRNELHEVQRRFERAAYDTDRNVKTWRAFYFYLQGRPNQKNLDACPRTKEILQQIPLNKLHVCFSAIEPGGLLQPHTGPTNTSLTAHLGLENCDGAAIWVASHQQPYREGKVLIFDDSFVHWVEHTGQKIRYTLMITFWHPELNALERTLMAALVASTPQHMAAHSPNPLDKKRGELEYPGLTLDAGPDKTA
jgi:aspartyl/asparaginyl beta-hydroxylase (cupin superfamily)